ncbi:unnamed protein product, partial [Ectocarpus sp. 13 AM-2016]
MSKMRRRKYSDCVNICSDLLAKTPRDQAIWYLKCRALTLEQYLDDTEMEEQVRSNFDTLLDFSQNNCVCPAPQQDSAPQLLISSA